jgi:S-methylmethionine-dependent homocysteine/selenocysteine methylase
MNAQTTVTLLDGGMGRQLSRLGAPFRLPEWSALALIEAPEYVFRAHQQFAGSGADVITTNSYGLVPHMIGKDRFAAEGLTLAARAGRLAREAADHHVAGGRRVRVAGSLPPTFESYRPELFEAARAAEILGVLVEGLTAYVDFWLIETQSSINEALTAIEAVRDTARTVWVSYTLRDEADWAGPAQLRSGEAVEAAAQAAFDAGAEAVLFNCSQPEVMAAAVKAATGVLRARRTGGRVGVYANAFVAEPASDKPYAGISQLREDITPERYLAWASEWIDLGATIIGGCCGIGPEHIAALRAGLV